MKNKIIDFLSVFFFLKRNLNSKFSHKQEWINMNQRYILQKKTNRNKHLRINISFIEDRTLDIEFFDKNDDIEIKIYNQFANEMYRLCIFTMPTLHIIVEMNEWPPGFYWLFIRNEDYIFFNESFTLSKINPKD